VPLLAFTSTIGNLIHRENLSLKMGREPRAFGIFQDTNPRDPLEPDSFTIEWFSGSVSGARDTLRQRAEAGFDGILAFAAISPNPNQLYVAAFDLRAFYEGA
jgi:hypothetical protein